MEKRGVITQDTPAETIREANRSKCASYLPENQQDVAKMEAGPTRRLIDKVASESKKS